MRTYTDESEAMEIMRLRNRSYERANNYRDVCAMVDGPDDGEYTLMDIADAMEFPGYRIEY